jgi:hypothetical protein
MTPNTLIWLAIGIVVLVVTGALVLWTTQIQRTYTAPGDAIFARSPVGMLVCGVLVALSCVGIALTNSADLAPWFVLIGIFALLFGANFAQNYLLFWTADAQGLTQHYLVYKKVLPWQQIDWIYPSRKTTTFNTMGVIKVGQSTEEGLAVEAGPKLRTKLIVRTFMARGNPDALIAALRERATGAIYGYDQFPAVRERRAQSGYRPS